MKRHLQLVIKSLISMGFLYLVLKNVDFHLLFETLQNCRLPVAFAAILIAILLSFPLTIRWLILLKSQSMSGKLQFMNLWKLTMVGMLFNNFLPTGSGGDIAKVFYLVKGEENKLTLGSSVLVDRFLGAVTVITMGVIAGLVTPDIPVQTKYLLILFFVLLFLVFLFFSNKKLASFFYAGPRRILPARIKETLKNTYDVFNRYFSTRKSITYALLISFFLQSISIFNNYIMSISLLKEQTVPNIRLFFIYVPLIWTSTIIPSLGGLGVREFTYVYFFSEYMGKENAFALSVLFLLTIIVQSVIGAIILLFLKYPSTTQQDNPCTP